MDPVLVFECRTESPVTQGAIGADMLDCLIAFLCRGWIAFDRVRARAVVDGVHRPWSSGTTRVTSVSSAKDWLRLDW